DSHAGSACFVDDEVCELGEGPGVECDPLGLAEPYPFTDPRQLFEGDAVSGAFSLGHDRLGDAVVDVLGPPRFLTALLGQQPFGGLGALLLQLGPQRELPLAVAVQFASGGPVTGGGGGDVDDA